MKLCSLTDIGVKREMNQDYFYTSEDAVGMLPNLFLVADGMGGHKAGEFASRCATETFVSTAQKARSTDINEILCACAERANDAVLSYANRHLEMRGMGTTLVVAVLKGNTLYVANVGDSRLYVIGEDICQVTEDHSLVAEMVRMGEMDAQSAKRHPDRNIITRAVGVEPQVRVDVFTRTLLPGEKVLLCSDGLSNMVEDEELCRIANSDQSHEAKTEQMIQLANSNGGRDNITVIFIDPEFER